MTIEPKRHAVSAISRRKLLKTASVTTGLSIAAPAILKFHTALAQDKPAKLTVRTWGGVWLDSLRQGVSDPFSEATGIAIRHDQMQVNRSGPRILAAIDSGAAPPLHVDWNTTINATKLASRDATVDLSDIAGLDRLLPVARPEGFDGWPLVNTYGYVYALSYRDAAFPTGAPTSWQSMIDPRFQGRVAVFDDGNGMYPVAQIAGGGAMDGIPDRMEPCWTFLQQVRDNDPMLGEDPDMTTWLQNGDIDACCAITSDARSAKLAGAEVSWTVPQEGADYQTDAMVVPRGLPENETFWAKRYVEQAISAHGQQVWCTGLGLPPVYPDLTPPADLIDDPAYPVSQAEFDRLLRIPTTIVVANQSDWFARFQRLMGDG